MNWIKNVMVAVFLLKSIVVFASSSIDLSGPWQFALDAEDIGMEQKWYQTKLSDDTIVMLPGSIQEQGFGEKPGMETPWVGGIRHDEWGKEKYAPYRTAENFKMPFWLQPDKYYKGAAWYQKTVLIPESWKDKHVTLTLERPHWETHVWVGETAAGSMRNLSVPHTYHLGELLTPGEHVLTIRVDNRMIVDVGINAHSISDHTQSNWNGIVGDLKLKAKPLAWVEEVQVHPDLENKAVKVVAHAVSRTDKIQTGDLVYEILFDGKKVATHQTNAIRLSAAATIDECVIPLEGPIHVWDEYNPNLYTLKTRLKTKSDTHEHTTTFGLRQIELDGNRILLNGRRIFLRGTLECCIFPKTGYPPTDVESWKRIINICKAHGLNHIRFHSWCPPKAAFEAADKLGFYYQVECSAWTNYGERGIGNSDPVDQWIYDESDAILKAYGNHPSFLLFAYGNEPGGPGRGADFLRKWVPYVREKDPRRLVTGGAGWPVIGENEFHNIPQPRIQRWGEGLRSRINSKDPETATDYRNIVNRHPNQSVIAHETGQWCVYPNFNEIEKYDGVLKAKNFEVFRDFLEQKGMLDQAHDFLMASGKLQVLCYKEDIESALRTPNLGGFQLLDLRDFPGQGTAIVGVLDPFWDSKPYISPSEYKRFSGPVVPLARLPKRVFTESETLSAQVDVSQFGPKDLNNVKIKWSFLDTEGQAVRQGMLHKDKLAAGDLYTIGHVDIPLSRLPAPARYTLELAIENTDAINDWDVWVYPETVDTSVDGGILIARRLDTEVQSHLQQGGRVLLAVHPGTVKTDVGLGFSSIFWNTAWTSGQPPHTLGILCDPEHPALGNFPTEYHSNWQWSPLIQNAATMEMGHLPAALRPIVQVVPDWFDPKRLGLVFEAKVGPGSLLVCSVDIVNDLENQPVQRQLRYSLLKYMQSAAFKPDVKVDIKAIETLFTEPSPMQKLEAYILKTDSHQDGYEGDRAIDEDPTTFWHTEWASIHPSHPHEIQIGLKKSVWLKGVTYLPRQDGNRNGWVKEYAVYVSDSPGQWGYAAAEGSFERTDQLKTVFFEEPIEGQYVRFVSKAGFDADRFTSIAAIDLLVKE